MVFYTGLSLDSPRVTNMLYSMALGPYFTQYMSNLYSNKISKDYNQYLKGAYERQLADWNKYVGSQGKTIQYPELSFEGKARGAQLGIDQAIASAYRNTASYQQSLGYSMAAGYRASRSLYGRSTGSYSRYL